MVNHCSPFSAKWQHLSFGESCYGQGHSFNARNNSRCGEPGKGHGTHPSLQHKSWIRMQRHATHPNLGARGLAPKCQKICVYEDKSNRELTQTTTLLLFPVIFSTSTIVAWSVIPQTFEPYSTHTKPFSPHVWPQPWQFQTWPNKIEIFGPPPWFPRRPSALPKSIQNLRTQLILFAFGRWGGVVTWSRRPTPRAEGEPPPPDQRSQPGPFCHLKKTVTIRENMFHWKQKFAWCHQSIPPLKSENTKLWKVNLMMFIDLLLLSLPPLKLTKNNARQV